MKYRIIGTIAVISIFIYAFGAWSKILHRPNARLWLTIGIYGEAVALAGLAWFAFEYFRKKDRQED